MRRLLKVTGIHPLSPWTLFLRTLLVCTLVGTVLFGLSLRRIERLPLSADPLLFDGQKAWETMRDLAKGFPNRVTYTASRRKAAEWLKDRFRSLGYEPQGMAFSEVIAGQQYTDLENVFAEKRGTKHPEDIVVVTAHYDVTDTTEEGAMDDASGVGVVLELARVFSRVETERTVLFLLTDSEEFGAFWGAREFARQFRRSDGIVAVASFDFLAPEKQTRILTLCDGLKTGYTPLWLRELALDSIRSLGAVEAEDMMNVMELVERAILIPPADHGAFLAAGIPAFNWVGQNENFGHQMAHYHHTRNDVAEAMLPRSFTDYGQAAERLVRSISQLPRIPETPRDSSYWKVARNLFVDGWVVTILHVLAFIPFLVYCLSKFPTALKGRPTGTVRRVLRNEAKSMAIVLGSLLFGYVAVLLLPALKIITQYEVFPATQKSLMLYTPNFLAMAGVAALVFLVYKVFRRVFSEPDDHEAFLEIRHAFHGAFLAAIIFLAFLKNSYLAFMLLLPPAYLWTFLRARRRREDRILNTLLLVGGAITFVGMAIVMTTIFHVGVVYWYMFLSMAYGLFSAYAVVLFIMALTIMLRLFRKFVL